MASVNFRMGESSNLDSVPVSEGTVLYTTDTNELYIDTDSRNLVAQTYDLATTASAGLMSAEDKATVSSLGGSVVPIYHTLQFKVTLSVASESSNFTATLNNSSISLSNFNTSTGYFKIGDYYYSLAETNKTVTTISSCQVRYCYESSYIGYLDNGAGGTVKTYSNSYRVHSGTVAITYTGISNNKLNFKASVSSQNITTEKETSSSSVTVNTTFPKTATKYSSNIPIVYYTKI